MKINLKLFIHSESMRNTFPAKDIKVINRRNLFLLYFWGMLLFSQFFSSQILAQDEDKNVIHSLTQNTGYINPDSYLVGPGDSLVVLIKGMDEIVWKVNINHEGSIYIPKVGEINLKENSLSEAKKKIENSIKKYYKNVEIFVSLAEIRKIKVGLFGDVKKPSVIFLFANATLSDLLMNSALLNTTADLRNVKIVSDNKAIHYYDFISFIRTNEKNQNPSLHDGDFIYVDKGDKTISILGKVKFPDNYNFKPNETAFDAINLAGGFLTDAKKDSLEIIRFAEDNKTQKSLFLSLEESRGIILENKDKLIVRGLPEFLLDEIVIVKGFVKYPGVYKIKDGETKLSEIIHLAGDFLPKASLSDATLFRKTLSDTTDVEFERLKILARKDMTDDEYDYLKANARQPKGKVVVNFKEIFERGNKSDDIVLRKNDVIYVPEKRDYINLIGQVVEPGKIPFDKNMKVKDYIELAGGFGWRAVESDVRVVRANSGEWVDEDDVKELYPGDIIWVPENPPAPKFWDFTKDALFIVGQVAMVVTAAVAIIVTSRR